MSQAQEDHDGVALLNAFGGSFVKPASWNIATNPCVINNRGSSWEGIVCYYEKPRIHKVFLSPPHFWGTSPLKGSIDFGQLPREITMFSVAGNDFDTMPMNMSGLPPNIQALTLSNNKFSGTPDLASLSGFAHLADVHLDGNRFSGSVDLSSLPKYLSWLSLSHNQFSGTIDFTTAFASAWSLMIVSLDHNDFSGSVDLSRLPSGIDQFSINHNRFSGSLDLMGLSGYEALWYFKANSNDFSGSIDVSVLPGMMQQFDISHNKFDGVLDFSDFRGLGRLATVNIANNRFTGSVDFSVFQSTFWLSGLLFAHNKFSGSIDLSGLPRTVEVLDLSHNQCSGTIDFASLSKVEFPMLRQLLLISNDFSGSVDFSAGLPRSFQRLRLTNNQFSGTLDFAGIAGHEGLLELSLGRNQFSGTLNDLPLFGTNPHLEEVDVSSNAFSSGRVDFTAPASAAVGGSPLYFVNISNNPNLDVNLNLTLTPPAPLFEAKVYGSDFKDSAWLPAVFATWPNLTCKYNESEPYTRECPAGSWNNTLPEIDPSAKPRHVESRESRPLNIYASYVKSITAIELQSTVRPVHVDITGSGTEGVSRIGLEGIDAGAGLENGNEILAIINDLTTIDNLQPVQVARYTATLIKLLGEGKLLPVPADPYLPIDPFSWDKCSVALEDAYPYPNWRDVKGEVELVGWNDGCVRLNGSQPEWLLLPASSWGCTSQPTTEPTAQPTPEPTAQPTVEPTAQPPPEPTSQPISQPTSQPTGVPTAQLTAAPPTAQPTAEPTVVPPAVNNPPVPSVEATTAIRTVTETPCKAAATPPKTLLLGRQSFRGNCSGHCQFWIDFLPLLRPVTLTLDTVFQAIITDLEGFYKVNTSQIKTSPAMSADAEELLLHYEVLSDPTSNVSFVEQLVSVKAIVDSAVANASLWPTYVAMKKSVESVEPEGKTLQAAEGDVTVDGRNYRIATTIIKGNTNTNGTGISADGEVFARDVNFGGGELNTFSSSSAVALVPARTEMIAMVLAAVLLGRLFQNF